MSYILFFFFNDTATTEIYTLSLHDALPIFVGRAAAALEHVRVGSADALAALGDAEADVAARARAHVAHGELEARSEEHTSELQSRQYLVCRLLLEKKKIRYNNSLHICVYIS